MNKSQIITMIAVIIAILIALKLFKPKFEFLEIPKFDDCGCGSDPEDQEDNGTSKCVC